MAGGTMTRLQWLMVAGTLVGALNMALWMRKYR